MCSLPLFSVLLRLGVQILYSQPEHILERGYGAEVKVTTVGQVVPSFYCLFNVSY